MGKAGKLRTLGYLALGLGFLSQAGCCSTMSHTDRGMLAGGGIGAIAGTVVGAATGHPGAGAVIGTGLGAVAGGIAGSAADEREYHQHARAVYEAQQRSQMSLMDVADLSQKGLSDALIIDQIRATGSRYRLTAEQISWLQRSGVREPVIQAMIQTGVAYPPPGGPVYVVEPGPVYVAPPPPPVSVGVIYRSRGRCW